MHATQLTTSFGDGSVLLWMLEFFLFVIWFWLLLSIFGDLFRDHDLSGGLKALWVIVLVVLPYLGILIYLIARGQGMSGRAAAEQARVQHEVNAHIRSVAGASGGGGGAAEQIAQAKSLLDSGAITQAEFDHLKSQALAG